MANEQGKAQYLIAVWTAKCGTDVQTSVGICESLLERSA